MSAVAQDADRDQIADEFLRPNVPLRMKELARVFDLPIASREHVMLSEEAWMGGPLVSVRFYLGRLLGRNQFRETDANVERQLVRYISRLTSDEGGNLLRGGQGWTVAGDILRYRFEMQTKGASSLKSRDIAAVERFLANPSLTVAQLARKLGTTEKQLSRICSLTPLFESCKAHSRKAAATIQLREGPTTQSSS